jgi:hypothetical protein
MPVDTKEIIEKYKRLHIDELVELAASPGELRDDVLPFLHQELIQRGRTTEAQAIADWITNGGNKEVKEAQYDGTAEWVKEAKRRANDEEPLSDIVKEAAARSEETLTELKKQGWYQEAYVDYIKELRNDGLTDEQINEKLGIGFSLEDANKYRRRLRRNGTIAIIAGVIALIRGVTGYEETKKYGGDDVAQMINIVFLLIGLTMSAISIVAFIKSKD